MNRRVRVASFFSALLLAMLCPHGDAAAQIDIGDYMLLDTDKAAGRSFEVGSIRVNARARADLPYSEQWLVLPEYLGAIDRVLEIVPASAADSAKGLDPWKSERGAHRIEVLAREHELAQSADEGGALLRALQDVDPDVDSGEIVSVREIWQTRAGSASRDRFELVGLVCASRSEGGPIDREAWLLSESYVYPSRKSDVRTQLRPAKREGAEGLEELLRSMSGRMSVRRYIRVALEDHGPPAAQHAERADSLAGCAPRHGHDAAPSFAAFTFGLALLLRGRARSAKRPRE